MPGPHDRLRDEERRHSDGSKVLLDAIERLAILETKVQFSDLQRTELLTTTSRLGDRLGEIALGIRGLSELSARVTELEERHHVLDARLDAHDLIFAETKGGLRAARFVWGVLWGIVGASVGALVSWITKGH